MSDDIENGQESEVEDPDLQDPVRLDAASMENLSNWARQERGQNLESNSAQLAAADRRLPEDDTRDFR
ncbi:MAG: hypothetical protein ACKVJG_24290 [Candidatus Latescibacterota bacterium]|jgi:hypothetical protein